MRTYSLLLSSNFKKTVKIEQNEFGLFAFAQSIQE